MSLCWVATLSDGTQEWEHEGEYEVLPGERLPWVRLTENLRDRDQHLVSLDLVIDGKWIHLPSREWSQFSTGKILLPIFYSLSYIVESEILMGIQHSESYIDVVAHFENFQVHLIVNAEDEETWIQVSEDFNPMAPTPSVS